MTEFIFNDCGVCTNPNKYGLDWRNYIATAQCPDGRWVFGINYQLNHPNCEGGGFGASSNSIETYATEREAAIAAIKGLDTRLSKRGYKEGCKEREDVDACIAYTFSKFTQLTLF